MADEFPERACAECDSLKAAVTAARRVAKRVEEDMVKRYAGMSFNDAQVKHAEASIAHGKLKKAYDKLDAHYRKVHVR